MVIKNLLNSVSLVLALAVSRVISDEPFCGNKCYDNGVSTIRSCYCDKPCSYLFNDCCGDSEHVLTKYGHVQHQRKRMSCDPILNGKSALVVNSCPPDWNGPEDITDHCHQSSDLTKDPFGSVPVTNPSSGITYSSYYCAICNSDAQTMVFWKIRLSCPSLDPDINLDKQEIINYVFYNQTAKHWGFLISNDDHKSYKFHGCNVVYTVPNHVASIVHNCEPGEVDECVPSWKQDIIRQMCAAYTDPVYANNTRYKNLYCAICNQVDHSHLSCGTVVGPRLGAPKVEPPNFAILMDVNTSDGNRVGKTAAHFKECAAGEVYDPFKKSCRNIVCGLPGYHVQDGKCEKIPE